MDILLDPFFVSSALLVATAAILGWFICFHKKKERDARLPPLAITKHEPLQFIINLMSTTGPQFLLNVARDLRGGSETTKHVLVFQVPELRLLPFIPPPFLVFVVADYRIARTILENPAGTKPHIAYEFFDLIAGGDTFISHSGHRANHARKAISPAFAPQNVKRMTEIIERILETWIDESLKDAAELDIAAEMVMITTDIISQVGFNYNMSLAERAGFVEDMNIASEEFFLVLNPLRKLQATSWMFGGVRQARRATKRLHRVCYKMLEEYRRCRQEDPNSPVHSTIVAMVANNSEYQSDRQRASDMLVFFYAGYDTTASALGWTFLELARHPKEQTKLRQALRNCSSKEEMRNCDTLKNVSREILRLHTPAALGSTRELPFDLPVPDTSQVIPAGSVCFMPFYLILRDGSVFENPDSFVPDRWNNPSPESLKALIPFAAGRRNCIGMSLAQAEMSAIIARMCSVYQFTVVDEGHSKYLVTLKAVGMKLAVKRVED
jgi:cytochrome P450